MNSGLREILMCTTTSAKFWINQRKLGGKVVEAKACKLRETAFRAATAQAGHTSLGDLLSTLVALAITWGNAGCAWGPHVGA